MTESTIVADYSQRAPRAEVSAAIFADDFRNTALILARARMRAATSKLPYAGAVTLQEACTLLSVQAAVLVDVRTAEECQYVGHVPDSVHVSWISGAALQRNPRFVGYLESKVHRDQVLLLLCRSGDHSAAAAKTLTEARFRNVFNVTEGFEGGLDELQQRSSRGGWGFHRLPWMQHQSPSRKLATIPPPWFTN
jgi:rhodanese-related sulfurtransferase